MTSMEESTITSSLRRARRINLRPRRTTLGREEPFAFDRLGVRVPAILVSPWIPKGTVVDRVFDHASIPATMTKFFLGDYAPRSPRETSADVFIEPKTAAGRSRRGICSRWNDADRLSGVRCVDAERRQR